MKKEGDSAFPQEFESTLKITFGLVQQTLRKTTGIRWQQQNIADPYLAITQKGLIAGITRSCFPEINRTFYSMLETGKTQLPEGLVLLWVAAMARSLSLPAAEMGLLLQAYMDPSQIDKADFEKVKTGQLLDPITDPELIRSLDFIRDIIRTPEQSAKAYQLLLQQKQA